MTKTFLKGCWGRRLKCRPLPTPFPARPRERLYESGNCVQRICAILGVHPKDAQRPSGVQNQPVLRRFSRVTSIDSTSGVSGRTKYIRVLGTAAEVLWVSGATRPPAFARFHSRMGTAIGRQDRLLLFRTTSRVNRAYLRILKNHTLTIGNTYCR